MTKRRRTSRSANSSNTNADSEAVNATTGKCGEQNGEGATAADAVASPPNNPVPPEEDDQSIDGDNKQEEGVKQQQQVQEDGDGTTKKRKRKRNRPGKKNKTDAGGDGAAVAGGERDGGGGGENAVQMAGVKDTIYVEGIPYTCDESDVREFFRQCGKITDVRMPRWHDSGKPRGYAHVSFAGVKGARAAFGLDGKYMNGRYLTVQVPQEPATEKARRANRTLEQPAGCRTVFVKNLPYDADEDGLSEALAGCGRIASVRLAMWNHTKKLKGFGYVEFVTERGAETCVRTQESLSVGGRPIVVDFETGAPKGSFRRQDGAQIRKTSADAGVGRGKAPKFKVHIK